MPQYVKASDIINLNNFKERKKRKQILTNVTYEWHYLIKTKKQKKINNQQNALERETKDE